MSLLTELLKDDPTKQEAKMAKPLVEAKADEARLNAVGEAIGPICTALGIEEMPVINSKTTDWDKAVKERAKVIGGAVGEVLKAVKDSR